MYTVSGKTFEGDNIHGFCKYYKLCKGFIYT